MPICSIKKVFQAMKINDDEFDYIFYTYGLNLYKNMPLIEPLEYKDTKQLKEFVIAIDTSGSTSGDLVQKFLQKTHNILTEKDLIAKRINLHIVQCDTKIQDDAKLCTPREIDAYIKYSKIKGLGGTDFRPVFEHVDNLIKIGEFKNFGGLIYFTDEFGTYPTQKPDYKTAFVFVDDNAYTPDVPSWTIKILLNKYEF